MCKKCSATNSVHLISLFAGVSCLAPYPGLTRRENQIISFLARGMTPHAIAEKTGICISTVYKHRENILLKLEAHSTREVVAFLYRAQKQQEQKAESHYAIKISSHR